MPSALTEPDLPRGARRAAADWKQTLHAWVGADGAPTTALELWAGGLRGLHVDLWTADLTVAAPEVVEPAYVSADTAPRGFAVRRAGWVTPLFFASFTAASVGLAFVAGTLTSEYARLLGFLSGTDPQVLSPAGSSISIRPFALAFFALLGLWATGAARHRLRFIAGTWAVYGAMALAADVALAAAQPLGAPGPLSAIGGIVSIAVALLTGVHAIFTQYELPPGIRVLTEQRRAWSFAVFFLVALALVVGGALAADAYRQQLVDVAHFRPLAALTSTAVILVVGLQLVLFLVGSRRGRPRKSSGPPPSVGFLIPAYNEASSIAATIVAIDAAASRYPGTCRLYLVDNGSTDTTALEAEETLSRCPALEGRVLHCPTRGKAHALNFGLAQTTEDVVVRVDSDTIVRPSLLNDLAPHFSDETVGGVSGLPLPRSDAPRWLAPFWLMEIYHSVGFIRVGQNAIDGAVVLPGSMSAYRGEVVRKLGGFAVGHNGEDGDMAVRIGRLGYRLVTDPRIEFYTELPATLGHLVEQRQRWYRGIYYKTARNKSSIVLRQGLRGVVVLPWAALTACRRALTAPIIFGIAAASIVDPSIFSLRELIVIGGSAIGANLVVVALLLVANGRPGALPFVPAYLVFRVFKLYVAFQTLLTLELRRRSRGFRTTEAETVALESLAAG